MADLMTDSLPAPNPTPGRYPLPPAPPPEVADIGGSSEALAQWTETLDAWSRKSPDEYRRGLELAEGDIGTLPVKHAEALARMRGLAPGQQQQQGSTSAPRTDYPSLNIPAIVGNNHDLTPQDFAEAHKDWTAALSSMNFEDRAGAAFARTAIESAVVWASMDATAQQQHLAEVNADLRSIYGDRTPEMIRIADAVAARIPAELAKEMSAAGYFRSTRAIVALVHQGRRLGL